MSRARTSNLQTRRIRNVYPGKKKYILTAFLFARRYYLATSERDSAVQHLYRVSLLDSEHKSMCLSCNIVRETDGSRCLYNAAKFSVDNSHYVLTCAGPGVPSIAIYNKVRVYPHIRMTPPIHTSDGDFRRGLNAR